MNGNYFNLYDEFGNLIDSVQAMSDSVVFSSLLAGVYNYQTSHSGTCGTQNQDIYVIQPNQINSNFLTISDTFYIDTSGFAAVYFKNLSVGAFETHWDFGDNSTSTNQNPTHLYNNPGNYIVTLTIFNDSVQTCSDVFQKSITVISPLSVGINALDNKIKLDYYDGEIHYETSTFLSNIHVFRIFDMKGNLLKKGCFSGNQGKIDINTFNKGLYVISITDNDKLIKTLKFTK